MGFQYIKGIIKKAEKDLLQGPIVIGQGAMVLF